MLLGIGSTMPKLLFLQVGATYPDVALAKGGDYDVWFREVLLPSGTADMSFEVLRVFDGDPLPSRFDYAGVVVSGSSAMVTDRAPWSEATAAYLREAHARGVPILGVCYGHQLLADALGGEVGNNAWGRHAGTARVSTTPEAREDALFSVLPADLDMQVSHLQHVQRLPPGAVLLASAARDPHHAFRLGKSTWGVQFHPEFDALVSRSYIETRRATIAAEGGDADGLLAAVRDSDHGRMLLRRFAEIVRGGSALLGAG